MSLKGGTAFIDPPHPVTPEAQLLAMVSSAQARRRLTRAYTAGVVVEQRLLPQDTMPTNFQTLPSWHTRGPPESPCKQKAGSLDFGQVGWGGEGVLGLLT